MKEDNKSGYKGKASGERKSYGKPSGEGKSYGKPSGEGKSYGKPSGEGKSYGKPSGEGKSYGKPSGEGKSYGDRAKSYSKPYGENKPKPYAKSSAPAKPSPRPKEPSEDVVAPGGDHPGFKGSKRGHDRSPRPTFYDERQIYDRDENEETTQVEGRNAVIELLRSDRAVDKLYMAKDLSGRMTDILALAHARSIVVTECDRRKLDQMSRSSAHQGVIASAAAKEYVSLEEIVKIAQARGEAPLILVCDGITDPGNLGAMIRSAETAGAHGVVIPKRRSSGLNDIASKASAGALEHMAVARVTNMASALEELKTLGLWIFGSDTDGDKNIYTADFIGPAAIVVGSEGEGMSRIVREKCDFIVSIPLKGNITSLNAGAAAAVLLFESVRQRLGGK